jgi:hypothetical protein
VRVAKYKIQDIPKTEKGQEKWLNDLFVTKDNALKYYHAHGQFSESHLPKLDTNDTYIASLSMTFAMLASISALVVSILTGFNVYVLTYFCWMGAYTIYNSSFRTPEKEN